MIVTLAAAQIDWFTLVIGLFGGLALFLFGMEQMTRALKLAAGEGMKMFLDRLTRRRVTGALTGAMVTGIMQSSSVTTVLLIGFVSAGLMSLQQSVAVIMGANIGSTVTAQIIAFKITKLALVLVAVGFAMTIARRERVGQYGAIVLGLGLLFLGMEQMGLATSPLRDNPAFVHAMNRMNNPMLGILAAAALTAIIQSSAATMGIAIVLAGQGFISLEAGIALAFGANIGTCVTALLASIGRPRVALQTAIVHVIFNVIGVLLWLAFIPQLAELVRLISPQVPELHDAARLAAETPRQIANAHTVFNVVNTLVLLPFTALLALVARRLCPVRLAPAVERAKPQFLDTAYLDTPDLALHRVQLELGRLGQFVQRMIANAFDVITTGTGADLNRLERQDDDVDDLQTAIVEYLRKMGREELTTDDTRRLQQLTAVAIYLENAADVVTTNLVALGRDRIEHKIEISDVTRRHMTDLYRPMREAFDAAMEAVTTDDTARARHVIDMKDRINQLVSEVLEQVGRRLVVDAPKRVEAFRIETDMVSQFQRLYSLSKRIARCAAAPDEDWSVAA